IDLLELDGYPDHVLAFIILGTPLAGLAVKDKGPFFIVRDNVKTVLSCGQGFTLYPDVFAGFEGSRLVGTSPPDFAVFYKVAPNSPSLYCRTAVIDRDLGVINSALCRFRRTCSFLSACNGVNEHHTDAKEAAFLNCVVFHIGSG